MCRIPILLEVVPKEFKKIKKYLIKSIINGGGDGPDNQPSLARNAFLRLLFGEWTEAQTVFSKNRDRLLTTAMSRKFLAAILAHCEVAPLVSDEHFSADGTLLSAWASLKSVKPKGEDTLPGR